MFKLRIYLYIIFIPTEKLELNYTPFDVQPNSKNYSQMFASLTKKPFLELIFYVIYSICLIFFGFFINKALDNCWKKCRRQCCTENLIQVSTQKCWRSGFEYLTLYFKKYDLWFYYLWNICTYIWDTHLDMRLFIKKTFFEYVGR